MSAIVGEELREKAQKLKDLDESIKQMKSDLAGLTSEREQLSDAMVLEMQSLVEQSGEGIKMADIGFVKLETKMYPTVLDINGLQHWAASNNQELPSMTFNASTFGAWLREQFANSLPIPPEDLVKTFNKTRIKITKGG